MTKEAARDRPVRTFIYGSCVSRDSFEFLDPSRFVLDQYVARQSIISGMGPAAPVPAGVEGLSSAFQRRMLTGDAHSSVRSALAAGASGVDLLVLDLVDERLGVFEHPDGSYTTDSVELRSLGPSALPKSVQRVPFGSWGHQRRFTDALCAFRAVLDDAGMLGRTVLIAPPWAESNRDGGEPAPSFGERAPSANPVHAWYRDAAADVLGVPLLGADIPVHAEPDHRWGSAPFHYDDDTYTAIATDVSRAVEGADGPDAVRITTLRRRGSDPLVTLRQTGPATIRATIVAPDAAAFAFHLYVGTQRIEEVHYHRSPAHTFHVSGLGPGPFRVRGFVRDADGRRHPAVSARLRLEC